MGPAPAGEAGRCSRWSASASQRSCCASAPQPADVNAAATVLDPDALTIGFARRFATYKRATLLFRDQERLKRILNDPERPVQIVFAGKAHPADEPGKAFIQQVYQLQPPAGLCGQDRLRRRLRHEHRPPHGRRASTCG